MNSRERQVVLENHYEFSLILGKFMTAHMARVFNIFEGDIVAAIVLGTIGQYNIRVFYDTKGRDSPEGFQRLIEQGMVLSNLRPCNAMSIAASTGIPRETVRRKIEWLLEKGWIRRMARDKLMMAGTASKHFKDFDLETCEHFHDTMAEFQRLLTRYSASATPGPAAPIKR